MTTFEIVEGPLPTSRERQISWLQFCFAVLADIPMANVTVVHADDQEAITVTCVCPNPCRCMRTFTHWCTSEDEHYTFQSSNGYSILMPLEPHAGEM